MQTDLTPQPVAGSQDPVKELLESGRQREFHRRVRLLQRDDTRDRRRAAVALAEFGDDALEPLCRALEDRDGQVKTAVVKSLAHLGNPAAIRPIAQALKRSLAGGSGRRHVALAWAPLTVSFVGACGALVLQSAGHLRTSAFLMMVCGLVRAGLHYSVSMQNHARFHEAVIEALAELAERDPVPELREVLPDVQALAGNRSQNPETRRVLTEAVARIDRLTQEVRNLPIAAAPPAPSGENLPRLGVNPNLEMGSLPRTIEGERS